MRLIGRLITSWLIFLLMISCCGGGPDISKIKPNIEIHRLDKEIFNCSGKELSKKYGEFFDRYSGQILGIGKYGDPHFQEDFEIFKNDELVKIADSSVKAQYSDLSELTRKLNEAFGYYHYYFPDKHIPKFCTYVSGFCHSIILTDSLIAVGLDKYLGADYRLYRDLQFHKYMIQNMNREKIISDCITAWLGGEWFFDSNKNNSLIAKMIYEGKIFHAAKMILPNEPDSLIFGFSADQIKWCENNEKEMWIHLIDNKLLFSTDAFKIKKLTEFAPYTAEFTAEAPGRACNWTGCRIVERYVENNPQTTLRELMDNENYDEIYKQAKYKP